MLSCEYCEIFKNIYFKKHLQTAASRLFLLEWTGVESIDEARKQCTFAVTRPFLLKCTSPKPFFRENLQKLLKKFLKTFVFLQIQQRFVFFYKNVRDLQLLYHLMRSSLTSQLMAFLNSTRFCFSVPYVLCMEKNYDKKRKKNTLPS